MEPSVMSLVATIAAYSAVLEAEGYDEVAFDAAAFPTLDKMFMTIDLRHPKDLVLELEEVVALDVDGCAAGCDLLNVPRAEPDADIAVVAGAGR